MKQSLWKEEELCPSKFFLDIFQQSQSSSSRLITALCSLLGCSQSDLHFSCYTLLDLMFFQLLKCTIINLSFTLQYMFLLFYSNLQDRTTLTVVWSHCRDFQVMYLIAIISTNPLKWKMHVQHSDYFIVIMNDRHHES